MNKGHTTPGRARTREATIILDMLDPKDPIIRRLVKRGYRVSAHAHLTDSTVVVSYIAFHPKTKRNVQGRSRRGDLAEALRDLAEAAGVVLR